MEKITARGGREAEEEEEVLEGAAEGQSEPASVLPAVQKCLMTGEFPA